MTCPRPRCRAFAGLMLALGLLMAGAALAYVPDPSAPRADVPADFQWRPSDLFPTTEAWEKEFAAVSADLPTLEQWRGKLAESPETIYACLEAENRLRDRLYALYVYADSRFNSDQGIDENKVRNGRIQMLLPAFGQAVSYIEPELLTIDRKVLDGFLARDAKLAGTYRFYLENVLRLKAHTLQPGEEKILALTGNLAGVPAAVQEAMLNLDIKFPKLVDEQGRDVPLTLTGFSRYRSSPVYNVRRQAADDFFATLRQYENTLATSLDGVVKAHIMNKDARGYSSCLEAALTPDDISPAAYHMLVETIDANLGRSLHRYIALRRKVLGLDGPVTFANLYNPLVDDVKENYSYPQAEEMILTALKPLGPDYLAQLRQGLNPASGWVDVYPNAGKRGGAYSNGSAREAHPFILLNYDNSLDAVSTTAHEFGHAMHSVYSNRNQPPVYSGYTTFLAEVASTCNEALLLDYMLAHTTDIPERLNLLNQRLESIRLTIFRQTLFAEFELRFHEQAEKGEPLTAAYLDATYKELIQKYYGPDYAVGENDEVEWAFIPHFYYNFYVFSYATGLTSGLSLATQITAGGQPAADRYINGMLKQGASAPPLTLLRNAGVDLETPRPILDMLDMFEKTVAEFDRTWTQLQQQRAAAGRPGKGGKVKG
ncbi:MAG: oligoendopeptidase F [Candidatus Krumholzibacteriia bacterium]